MKKPKTWAIVFPELNIGTMSQAKLSFAYKTTFSLHGT